MHALSTHKGTLTAPQGVECWTGGGWRAFRTQRAWAMQAARRPCSCLGTGNCPSQMNQRHPAANSAPFKLLHWPHALITCSRAYHLPRIHLASGRVITLAAYSQHPQPFAFGKDFDPTLLDAKPGNLQLEPLKKPNTRVPTKREAQRRSKGAQQCSTAREPDLHPVGEVLHVIAAGQGLAGVESL